MLINRALPPFSSLEVWKGFNQAIWRVLLVSKEAPVLLEMHQLLQEPVRIGPRRRPAQCSHDNTPVFRILVGKHQLRREIS